MSPSGALGRRACRLSAANFSTPCRTSSPPLAPLLQQALSNLSRQSSLGILGHGRVLLLGGDPDCERHPGRSNEAPFDQPGARAELIASFRVLAGLWARRIRSGGFKQ